MELNEKRGIGLNEWEIELPTNERTNGILERKRRRDRRPSQRGGGRPLGNDGAHHSGIIGTL